MKVSDLLNLYNSGKYEELTHVISRIKGDLDSDAFILNLQAGCFFKMGDNAKSVKYFKRIKTLHPKYIDTYINLGIVLTQLDKYTEAHENFSEALCIVQDNALIYFNLGLLLKKQRHYKNAYENFIKATELDDQFLDAWFELGNIKKLQGHYHEAINFYDNALTLGPKNFHIINNLANCYFEIGDFKKSERLYYKSLKIREKNPDPLANLALLLAEKGDKEKALDFHLRCIDADPYLFENYFNLSLLPGQNLSDADLLRLEELLQECTINSDQVYLAFALGNFFASRSNFQKAFQYFSKGNKIKKKINECNIHQEFELFDKSLSASSELDKIKNECIFQSSNIIPVFIVGMPRSGTTLIEQMLASHSQITSLGELEILFKSISKVLLNNLPITKQALHEIRQNYFSEITKMNVKKGYFIDKLPYNFLFINFITVILPEAKIIKVDREPHAVCWSNFKQLYRSQVGYCYDLEDIRNYYISYREITDLFKTQYPKIVYEVCYEDLVEGPKENIIKLLDYLSLNFEDACLSPNNKYIVRTASKFQVKGEIYKDSSKEWRKYSSFLPARFLEEFGTSKS